jgi:hypothetical protein
MPDSRAPVFWKYSATLYPLASALDRMVFSASFDFGTKAMSKSSFSKTEREHRLLPHSDAFHWTYDHIDPSYVPGSHEIERGEVTWHDVTKREKQDPINDVSGRRRPPITKTQAILILVGAIVAACFFVAIYLGSVH